MAPHIERLPTKGKLTYPLLVAICLVGHCRRSESTRLRYLLVETDEQQSKKETKDRSREELYDIAATPPRRLQQVERSMNKFYLLSP